MATTDTHPPRAPEPKPVKHPLDLSTDLLLAGEREQSLFILRHLEKENPDDPRVRFNLGWHYCYEGKWKEAVEHLDTGRFLNVFGSPPLRGGRPIWQGESLAGKTIHLRCEGGFGDEIINLRFARDLAERGATVVVSCSPSLTGLFSRAPGVRAVVGFPGADHVHCDWWLPAMSAPQWFAPRGGPYLAAEPSRVEKWSRIIRGAGRLKAGIRWSGNPKFEWEQHRKFPTGLMTGLAAQFPDVSFFSLQRDNDLVDLPGEITDLRDLLADFDDTAAAIHHLDVVITSCTSVAHLAAAMGKETWVIVPILPYYLWAMPGERSPWYDTVRLFRQEKYGEWEKPFAAARAALTELLAARKAI